MESLAYKSSDPLNWDFQRLSYNVAGDVTDIRAYATMSQAVVSGAAAGAGTVTVTTSEAHGITMDWSASVTYATGTRVYRAGKCWVSTANGNLNNKPESGNVARWVLDDSLTNGLKLTCVNISGVAGMTDLNNSFAVVSTPSSTTFVVTLTTAQVYSSGGLVKAGHFRFRKHLDYNSTPDVSSVSLLYTE
jgi:hypothetical protein